MTYRQYRSFGHGPFVAFTLSVHPVLFFGVPIVIGSVIGVLLK